MKKKLTLLSLLFTLFSFSQNENKIEEKYAEYFNNEREIPYLHLNKTSFLKGEEIWFKAYILNTKTKKTHQLTSNLHCAIYDEKGLLKKHKMLFVNNGLASGSFIIDSTFTNKKYFIKASTNYMKNFVEDASFLQEIKIIDNFNTTKQNTVVEQKGYDLQILPEGGHILANAINTLSIVLKDNNGEIPAIKEAKIIDNRGKFIENISINHSGNSKVSTFIKHKKEYTVEVTLLNGEKVLKKLPSKKLKGVTLSVDNISMNLVKFIIRTNKETLKNPLKKYTLFVHNSNTFIKEEIQLKENTHEYTTYIGKKLIQPGTNIVTLFDDQNTPIAERVFFNHQKSLFSDVTLNITEVTKDSLTINIQKKQKDSLGYSLSSTILPANTKVYKPKNSIFTTFLLNPYVKSDIPNITHLFEETNRKKLLELDLLLLNNGWSKYSWYNLFNTPNIELYKFQQGIDIKGSVNNLDLEKTTNLLLYSKPDNLFLTKELKNNTFSFENLYLSDTSSVKISLIDKKGNFKKPKAYITSIPFFKKDSIKISSDENFIEDNTTDSFLDFSLIDNNREVLKEVAISAKIVHKNIPRRFVGLISRVEISDHLSKLSFSSFLYTQGFFLSRGLFDVTIRNRRAIPNLLGEYPISRVFLNHQEITQYNDLIADLESTKVNEYEDIYTSNSLGGEIHLFTKKNLHKAKKNSELKFQEHKITNGYSIEKKYYTPKYTSTKNIFFENYASIYWEPKITLDKNNDTFQFRIPRLDQDNIIIELEGINSEGALIKKSKVFENIDSYNKSY